MVWTLEDKSHTWLWKKKKLMDPMIHIREIKAFVKSHITIGHVWLKVGNSVTSAIYIRGWNPESDK